MEGFIIRLRNCGICFVIAFLLFKFGGWHIIWGRGELMQMVHYVAPTKVIMTDSQSFIANKDGVVVRINKKFYGVEKDTKYFDSPLIQWGMLLISLWALGTGIYSLFGDDY